MKILIIWASADWSTADVSAGYMRAFAEAGHEVKVFMTPRRLEFWSEALEHWATVTGQEQPGLLTVLREASSWALVETAYYRPDLVVFISCMGFHPDAAALITAHGYKTAAVFTECPYDDQHQVAFAQCVNFAFANDRNSVAKIAAAQPHTAYLGTAYSPPVHNPDIMPEGSADVLFVGTGFPERMVFFEELATLLPPTVNLELHGFYGWQDDLPISPLLRAKIRPPCDNEETARRYRGAKIVLNLYREGYGYSLNPRAYEIAACGSFQLTQDGPYEAHEIFGDSIGYFSSPQDAAAAISTYLQNETLRVLMASESHARVKVHSYDNRANELLRTVNGQVSATTATAPVYGKAVLGISSG